MLKLRAGKNSVPSLPETINVRDLDLTDQRGHDVWNNREDLLKGKFTFLNQTCFLGDTVEWNVSRAPLLWQFNLHYFHYVHLLTLQEQVRLCQSWINANPPGTPVAWHPYATSLRIVNWCKTQMRTRAVLESLYQQAGYLFRHIEYHITGNHLIENARALVLAGRFFGDTGEASQWFKTGIGILEEELEEQILVDGGHYERSPMYQALMLDALLDVMEVIPESHPIYRRLVSTTNRMIDYLVSLTHPDGDIALFNDSTREIAKPSCVLADRVLQQAGHHGKPQAVFPDTGYYIHHGQHIYLPIDAGPVGPRHLTAHAHADIFSYELSLNGLQFVVDSGVFEYQRGAMRSYARSTKAHNTVSVDGLDQVECWDSFRVARRWPPEGIGFASDRTVSRFEGVFGGYAHLIGDDIVHRRRIRVDEMQMCVTVEDVIEGEDTHSVESFIHLHPDVELKQRNDHYELSRGGHIATLHINAPHIRVHSGWYCPEFGVRVSNKVIALYSEKVLPVEMSYAIKCS